MHTLVLLKNWHTNHPLEVFDTRKKFTQQVIYMNVDVIMYGDTM